MVTRALKILHGSCRSSRNWRLRGERTAAIRALFFSTTTTNDEDQQRRPFNKDKRLSFVQPPNPTWDYGNGGDPSTKVEHQHLNEEEAEAVLRRRWNMDHTSSKEKYALLSAAISPRPLALVSTVSNTGAANLALFSYFSLVSHNPAMLSLSLGLPRETRENILSTRQFTVNVVDETFIEAAHSASIALPSYVDEWVLSGLSKESGKLVRPTLVKESPMGMECELYSFQDICLPNSSEIATTIVLGSIKYLHIRSDVLDDSEEMVDPVKFRAVGRLGGESYARLIEAFDLPHPSRKLEDDRYNGLLG
ncbi:flavoprotein oxygenase [Coprinopsis cinerea okayama7|uniref:Flavoprotein oxygenase n=1 Tax=Coprinopsis cinerea (strain Okayama-7 / 130 / ATCC MYA-4618 / FGSC 9003) TaxID=240176 RepID=A8N6W9_COPC7|nr:flavoprotein oxygenase [Coprinopsis cinerea okayama7\|eukprot:XP_001830575.2 flavoprotein oxygenase [Coprinopsis cinerea okayama7\